MSEIDRTKSYAVTKLGNEFGLDTRDAGRLVKSDEWKILSGSLKTRREFLIERLIKAKEMSDVKWFQGKIHEIDSILELSDITASLE